MAELIAERFDHRLADATLIGILDGYYEHEDRAIADGYLRHDHRFGQETNDVLAELSARVPGARLPRQLRWDPEHTTTDRGHRETVATLRVELPDGGEVAFDVRSFDDIIRFANDDLAAAGHARRFYALETDGDWHAYLALTAERA